VPELPQTPSTFPVDDLELIQQSNHLLQHNKGNAEYVAALLKRGNFGRVNGQTARGKIRKGRRRSWYRYLNSHPRALSFPISTTTHRLRAIQLLH
jgi:hypothetical protein